MLAKLVNGPHAGLIINVENVAWFTVRTGIDGLPSSYTLSDEIPEDGFAVYMFDGHSESHGTPPKETR